MNCKIISKREIAPKIFDFVVLGEEIAKQAQAGQFLHILCGGETYLRRPISICDTYEDKVRFVFEVRGKGTQELSKFKIGEDIDILGPLGNPFNLDTSGGDGAIILVGGGIGTFPLLKLAKSFSKTATAILGYRNKEFVTLQDEFVQSCKNVFVTTDDGSLGYHGFTTDILREIVKTNKVSAIYTCGPHAMMKLIAEIAITNDIPCQVSMEQRMGCGVGACVTCICSVAGRNVRVCKDGPVFYAKDVNFND